MDIKVNQINSLNQIEAKAPTQEVDSNFKFTLISNIEEQELQARLNALVE